MKRSTAEAILPEPAFRIPAAAATLDGFRAWVLSVEDSSVEKDTQALRESYHRATISEYWIINAQFDEIDFQI